MSANKPANEGFAISTFCYFILLPALWWLVFTLLPTIWFTLTGQVAFSFETFFGYLGGAFAFSYLSFVVPLSLLIPWISTTIIFYQLHRHSNLKLSKRILVGIGIGSVSILVGVLLSGGTSFSLTDFFALFGLDIALTWAVATLIFECKNRNRRNLENYLASRSSDTEPNSSLS